MPNNSTPRGFERNARAYQREHASHPSGREGIHAADYDRVRPDKDPDTLHHSVQALTDIGSQYFLPEAMELLRRTGSKKYLTDDEILLLVVTAVQAVRARHVEIGDNSAQIILQTIGRILDHEEVIRAEYNKLYALFGNRPKAELSAEKTGN